jgi:hypothetical protein
VLNAPFISSSFIPAVSPANSDFWTEESPLQIRVSCPLSFSPSSFYTECPLDGALSCHIRPPRLSRISECQLKIIRNYFLRLFACKIFIQAYISGKRLLVMETVSERHQLDCGGVRHHSIKRQQLDCGGARHHSIKRQKLDCGDVRHHSIKRQQIDCSGVRHHSIERYPRCDFWKNKSFVASLTKYAKYPNVISRYHSNKLSSVNT